jgi:hypothetical protein
VPNNLNLGEFDFIFEMNLGYESGDQVAAFGEKTRSQKSRASVPLRSTMEEEYCSRTRHDSVMLMSYLLAVIKYIVWMETLGETGTRGPTGLGGKWAVNRKQGTSVEHTCCCTWRVTTLSKRFLS